MNTTVEENATQENTVQSPLALARHYTARGWCVLPVPYKEKSPGFLGWQNLRLTAEMLPKSFGTAKQNIGVLLGEPSSNLADVDLDCPEAVRLAKAFLPDTGAIFGRASKRASHYLYKTVCKTKKYQDPIRLASADENVRKSAMIVELRSTGVQTLFPGSTNPSGESVTWDADGDPASVETTALQNAVAHVAAASMLARYWPNSGARQDAALALAGGLLRGAWSQAEVEQFIAAVCDMAGDEEASMRVGAVSYTRQKLEDEQEATGFPRLAALMDEKIVKLVREWLGIKGGEFEAQTNTSEPEPHTARRSQATALVLLADDAELFGTADDEAYASVEVGDHRETWSLKSRGFRRLLARRYYEAHSQAPSAQAIKDALGVLEGKALYEGGRADAYTRIAEHDGAIYLDLGDEKWRAVKVTKDGWQVIQNPPVRFLRTRGMLPLPLPIRGGSVDELDKFINVHGDERILVKMWLVAALRPSGPYTVLILSGEQGSAKSTTARVLCDLIDPNAAPLRSATSKEQDLIIAATNRMIVAYDNLSHITLAFSDALCRVATGGGYGTRELYSDGDEKLFNVQRPVLLTGIDELATRGDLLDRSIILALPTIEDTNRVTEAEFWQEFTAARPRILGALLDTVSVALREVDSVESEGLPRMADFAQWGMAAEQALGLTTGEFMRVYYENRSEVNSLALEASPFGAAVFKFMSVRAEWLGTADELLYSVNGVVDLDSRP